MGNSMTSTNPEVVAAAKRAVRLIAKSLSTNLSFAGRNRLLAFLWQATEEQWRDLAAHMEDMLAADGRLHELPMPKFWEFVR